MINKKYDSIRIFDYRDVVLQIIDLVSRRVWRDIQSENIKACSCRLLRQQTNLAIEATRL